jgi:hypothetical protein
VLIVPVKDGGQVKDYRVQYYQYPPTDQTINPELRNRLLAAGYTQEAPRVTARYNTAVSIRQGMDRIDSKSIDKALSYLEGRNPELYASLKKDLEPLIKDLQGAGGKSRENVLERMGQAIIDRLEKYPTDNLLIPSAGEGLSQGPGKDFGKDKVETGAVLAAMDIFSGGSGEDGGGHSINLKLKKKKKGQRQ